MEKLIQAGDMVVSRVNGTKGDYVVGLVATSSATGELTLTEVQPMRGREAAIERGYARKTEPHKVWLFDGVEASDRAYGEAPRPASQT